jgi:Zn-dependent protease with chaperone function/Zn-finger nucleic acid-binding protein
MKREPAKDFYEIQRLQQRKSFLLFLLLILFYFLLVGFVSSVFLVGIIFAFLGGDFISGGLLAKFILANILFSLLIASLHFLEAKKFGARFIRKRLEAEVPDLSDRYHLQFANTVEEMRIACGLPKVIPYIIPSFAINSMALIEPDNTPDVIITEGLLAEFTRDELEAVVAHELAHVLRGDTYYITLVCSLANVFERLRLALEPENDVQWPAYNTQQQRGGVFLGYLALSASSIIMHLLSTLISRQREILADAAAAEFSRNPKALAQAIYKAHLKNSFVGDFNLTYSPLFMVHPESRGEENGFWARVFNSHPPLLKRIELLAQSAHAKTSDVIKEVWEIQKKREKARSLLSSYEEAAEKRPSPGPSYEISQQEGKVWSICGPHGKWQGPYSLQELLFLQIFSPLIRVKNVQEEVEAQAREFPQIRYALLNRGRKKPIDDSKHNRCPHCRIPLMDTFYEGVAVKACSQCRGKLVDSALMDRLIARKEFGFSENLVKKAQDFRDRFMYNPILTKKITADKPHIISCPNCGARMLPRPFSYHYVIPVDKCLSCYKIWFDSDELEILQILIEKRNSW